MKKHRMPTLESLSERAREDPEWYWESVEKDIGIKWDCPYSKTLDSSRGIMWSRWFVGGKTNIYKSSVEKFSKTRPEKTAYHFVSEDGKKHSLSFKELDARVSRLANGLKSIGVQKGDVVAIYLPMIEEAIVAILASAKIGAIQTVIFSGYSTESLHVRLQDCNAKVLFASNGFCRKGRQVSQKQAVMDAKNGTGVETTVIVRYRDVDDYRDCPGVVNYDELTRDQTDHCATEIMSSEDPLFLLYTSGTTGKPKGVIHTHGGFSVFAGHQALYLVDANERDVIFWPADIGWITGLVWNVYGLLLVGACAVIYDGAIDFPEPNRIWEILSDHGATIFGISPTATRMLKKNNCEPPSGFNLGNIKNIPTTGEPLDEESWWWLFEKVGKRKIPIMNLSGGTEIGGAMLSVFPVMSIKPSTVGVPVPGMHLDAVDDNCNSVRNQNGYLVIRSPWPAMSRGLLNDNQRFLDTYWSRFENVWFHGDYVNVDDDGLWYMRGRTDDVINVSGHRMSTAEIEHAAITHPDISDAATVAISDDITGEAIVVFFVADGKSEKDLEASLTEHISSTIGKIARPKHAFQLPDLPKTRTGKIMRRLLKSRLLGHDLGDTSSLENPDVLDQIPRLN